LADRVVTLRRAGIGAIRILTVVTAAVTVLVWAAAGPLYAAVPAAVTLYVGRTLVAGPPTLTLGADGVLTIADPAVLKAPLVVPRSALAGAWHGPGVAGWLRGSMGAVGGLPLPVRPEWGLDLGPSTPDAVLAFEPEPVPGGIRHPPVGRGARLVPPMKGQPVDRLWMTFADPDDALASFAAWGRPLERVEEDEPRRLP
jgi:hypothetical protein